MVQYQPPMEWTQWVDWLAAGLHGQNRWRLSLIITGILFARGRRTVTTWLRAAGIQDDYAGYYYFLQPLARKAKHLAGRLLLLMQLVTGNRVLFAIDDSPTKRYGPQVQGAGIHHNPTPGPAGQKYLYGHIWVTISLVIRHPLWHTIGLPLLGVMYVRAKDIANIPRRYKWRFRTKLQLAAKQMLKFAEMAKTAGKTVWVVADGAYANGPFIKPLRKAGITVVSRLRKNGKLFTVPRPVKKRGRGQPRKYGAKRMYLAPRAAHRLGYTFVKRNRKVPMLETFDVPNPDVSIAQRDTTTVAPQALFLLNSQFTQQQAMAFARRIDQEVGSEPGAQVDRAFRLALMRLPSATEQQTSLEYMSRTATQLLAAASHVEAEADGSAPTLTDKQVAMRSLASLCVVLFNVNEFVYVD